MKPHRKSSCNLRTQNRTAVGEIYLMGLVHQTTNVFIKVRGSGRSLKKRSLANHFLLRWETSDVVIKCTVNKSNKKGTEKEAGLVKEDDPLVKILVIHLQKKEKKISFVAHIQHILLYCVTLKVVHEK